MQIHWTFEGCDEEHEAQIEKYWEDKQPELEAKLAGMSDDPSELRIAVHHQDAKPHWDLQAALHLSGQTLAAEGVNTRLEGALDRLFGALAREIDRLEEQPVEVTRQRQGIEAILPLLQRSHQEGRSDTFAYFLDPLIRSYGPYAQRELQVRENEGGIPGEYTSADELLDEALIRAWEGFDRRPATLSFDLWLLQLVDRVLDESSVSMARESIDEEVPVPSTENRQSQQDEWTEVYSYPETIELSELLAGEPGADAWDELEMEVKQTHLAEMLSKLPRDQRQAFVLNVSDGYSVAEIADFQDRAESEIQADIAEATRVIRRQFLAEQQDDEEEGRFVRPGGRDRRRRQRR